MDARADIDAERALLGAVLLDNQVLPTVAAQLRADDFALDRHRLVFGAMCALAEQGRGIDVVTLSAALREANVFNAVGGLETLEGLTEFACTTAFAEDHAAIVASRARGRRMQHMLEQALARSRDATVTDDALIEWVQTQALAAGDSHAKRPLVSLGESAASALRSLEAESEGRSDAIPTGIDRLDTLLKGRGLRPDQLVICAGRPTTGKSSLALQIGIHAARLAHTVLFVSLEMGAQELALRALAADCNFVLGQSIPRPKDFETLNEGVQRVWHVPLLFDDGGDATVASIGMRARALRQQHGQLGLIVIDYLQLMTGSGREASRELEVSAMTRGLKRLAKQLHVPILCLSQLNRGPENRTGDKRPRMNDLRESGAIEQDADIVLFVYRDELVNPQTEDRGIAELIVAKQRNGPTGTVRTRFVRELTRFDNLTDDFQPPTIVPANDQETRDVADW